MARAENAAAWCRTGQIHDGTTPLAVPLDVAAKVLARPLPELERAGIEPYRHADGYPVWSLRELAIAMGVIEPRRGTKQSPMPREKASWTRPGEDGAAPTGCRGRALAGGWASSTPLGWYR
jgi:hypothetical protein